MNIHDPPAHELARWALIQQRHQPADVFTGKVRLVSFLLAAGWFFTSIMDPFSQGADSSDKLTDRRKQLLHSPKSFVQSVMGR